jgi:kynurenine formamidase
VSTSSWLDVTMPLVSGMPRAFAYSSPVFDAVRIGSQPDGEPVTATHIEMYSHVGTHIESARHIFADGATLDEYPVERFTGPGYAFDLTSRDRLCIEAAELEEVARPVEPDSFVFLRLGGGPTGNQASSPDHPYLSEDAAKWLVDRRVRAVGVDTPTPDMDVRSRPHPLDLPVHRVLLGAGVLVIENLGESLGNACGVPLNVHAWPLNITGSDSSPVRVVVELIA